MRFAIESGAHLPVSDFEGWVRNDLQYADSTDSLVSAAEKVSRALRAVPGLYEDWLRSVFSDAPVVRGELIDAVTGLQLPLVTVNYDSLIEKATGREARTWREPREAQLILIGSTPDVLHLHGHWAEPDSLVFGSHSYGAHTSNSPIQALQQAAGLTSPFVFIGCGGTLRDPNFESLLAWLHEAVPASSLRSFLLCTDEEAGAVSEQHGDAFEIVVYGSDHAQLPDFLKELAPTAQDRGVVDVVRMSHSLILEHLRTTSLIAEHVDDLDLATIDTLVVPPVFLPVTPEQFSATKRDRELASTLNRVEGIDLCTRRGVHVLVADEGGGLTTALRWLVATSAAADSSRRLCPVYVDSRGMSAGPNPLDRLLRRELRLLDRATPVPACVVAIDNLAPGRPGFDRLMIELATRSPDDSVFLGCKRGSEADLVQRMRASGIEASVVYLGRMNRTDIEHAARLIDPARAAYLVKRTVELIQREHLPRTPQTVLLIVNMLLQGEAVLATASGTALLDAWVDHLLGRGDAGEDARFSLDAHGRASILGYLAERFVTERRGALPQATVIECFETYFQSVGWAESATDLLQDLAERRVLAVSIAGVEFTQSSYLHLFAARRAIEEPLFCATLLEDPLYFDSIIGHLAALQRNDVTVLRTVADLIKDSVVSAQRGRNFSPVEVEDAKPEDSIDRLIAELDLASEVGEHVADLPTPDPLELTDERDRVPFPADDVDADPPAVRVLRVLALVSSVLRDSEQVEDVALKQQVLATALVLWGRLVDALEVDDDFTQTVREVAESVADWFAVPRNLRTHFVDTLVETGAILAGYAMMTTTLTTRKLLIALQRCFQDDDFRSDPGASIMGALMAYDIRDRGWTDIFRTVLADHPRVAAVDETLRALALARYLELDARDESEAQGLVDFLSDQTAGTPSGPSTPEEKSTRELAAAKLRLRRRQVEMCRRLAPPESQTERNEGDPASSGMAHDQ